jgi:hypothetical protein
MLSLIHPALAQASGLDTVRDPTARARAESRGRTRSRARRARLRLGLPTLRPAH